MNAAGWAALVRDLKNVDDVDAAVAACERLHREATAEDLPRLRDLLADGSFFVREAAAWPLSEIAGAAALPELFQAYQRGFDEGHDNDSFSAVLTEMAAADPDGVRRALSGFLQSSDSKARDNASWLLEFCE